MISFKDYFTEGIIKYTPTMLDDMIKVTKALSATPLLYKGFLFKSFMGAGFGIDNDGRKPFRGSGDKMTGENNTAEDIVKGLNIKNPSFVSFDLLAVRYFGSAFVFIPQKPYKTYQSEKVRDCLVIGSECKVGKEKLNNLKGEKYKLELKKLIDSYTTNLNPKNHHEVIFEVKKYYLVKPSQCWRLLDDEMDYEYREEKGHDMNKWSELRTYADVLELLTKYKGAIRR